MEFSTVNDVVTERDRKALQRAKQIETVKKKEGYRWIPLGNVSKILVECDAKGHPTKAGQEKINKYKEYLGIND